MEIQKYKKKNTIPSCQSSIKPTGVTLLNAQQTTLKISNDTP